MRLSKRILSLVLVLALCAGLLPQLASADVTERTPEGKPVEFTDANGETVNVEEASWEDLYPYGAFLFPDGETSILEGGEAGSVKVYRLGGTQGRATAYIIYQPNLMQLDEAGRISYANAAGTDDIVIEVEDPLPIVLYQPIGRDEQPEPTQARLADAYYVGDDAQPGDRVLTVEAEADSWQWYASAYGTWQKVDGATAAEFVVDAESLDTYDFRCVYTSGGVSYCTDSFQGEAYEPEPEEELPEMPEDLDLNPEKTFSPLEPDPDDPYAGYIIPVTFADGEWVKEIRVTAPEDSESEAIKVGMFTLVDHLGADIYSGAATQTLTVTDNDAAEEFAISLTVGRVEADKAAGTAEIHIKRTGGNQTMVTVEYSTADGTAKAGRDYEATTGTAAFYGDIDETVVKVPLIDDGVASDEGLTFTLRLGEVKGDSHGLCTLGRTETEVVLTNSGAGEAAANLVTMLYDAEALDASGSVAIADEIAAPVDSSAVTGEQTLTGEDDIAYGVIEGFAPEDAAGTEDEAALQTYNYGSISFSPRTAHGGNYWEDTASVAGKAHNDITGWRSDSSHGANDGSAYGNGWALVGKSPAETRLRIPYMTKMYSGFTGVFETDIQWASTWDQVWYGDEFVYGMGFLWSNTETLESGKRPYYREDKKSYWYYPTMHFSKEWLFGDSWLGIGLALKQWDAHDSEKDSYARITQGTLTRRVLDNNLYLRIHTANDGESGNGNVATAPEGAAVLREGSGVYASMKPRVSIVSKEGGVNLNKQLYVGSKVLVSIDNLDSYSQLEMDDLNCAVYVTNSRGEVMKGPKDGPKIEGSGRNYYITMVWDNMTEADLHDTYTINVALTRKQTFSLDLSPSVPRKTGADGAQATEIDAGRIGEAWDSFWNSHTGSENCITVGCSEATATAPHFGASIREKKITRNDKSLTNALYELGKLENVQWINFNRDENDRILFNGKLYAGNEQIWLSVANLSFGELTFRYYSQDFIGAKSTMNLVVSRVEVYLDGDGDGRISGSYNAETGYFDPGVADRLLMMLERDASYNELSFQPVDLGNGKFGEYFLKIYYTMTPRSLVTPQSGENARAQVLPAFTTSVTEKAVFDKLTAEQQSYRYVMPGLNPKGSGRTSDGHLMYGAEASTISFVDVPMGGDRSPLKAEKAEQGYHYSWTPQYSGSLMYPFSDPEPIEIPHSLAGDNIQLADISYDDPNQKIKTDDAGKRNLNGYLGSFVADTTAALCVTEQKYTADQLRADPNSVNELQPESLQLIRRSATPNPNYLGNLDFQPLDSASLDPDVSGSKASYMVPDSGIDMPMATFDLLGLATVLLNKNEVMLTISVPLAAGLVAGDNSLVGGFPQTILAGPGDAWMQTSGLLSNMKEGNWDSLNQMFEKNGYKQSGNTMTSKAFVAALALSAVFKWTYDAVSNEYQFTEFGGALSGLLSFTFTVRFVPFPILYLYIGVSFSNSVSTGGNIVHEQEMRKVPYIAPDRARVLKKGEAVGYTLDRQMLSLQFAGKVYIEVLDQRGGTAVDGTIKGCLKSDGSAPVTRKLTTRAGYQFPDGGSHYLRIVALEDTTVSYLNVVEGDKTTLVWSGITIIPSFDVSVGAGLGVEGFKVEVCIKINVSAGFGLGKLQADGSRPGVSFEYFSAGVGVNVKAVLFGLSASLELAGYKISYIPSMGWVQTKTLLGKTSALKSDDGEGLFLGPPEDASGRQRIYSPGGDGGELMAYDADDARVPFQLSGYNSSVSAFKLADGLALGNDYQIVTANGVNYVLYTVTRSTDSPMDRPMLVLSRLVPTGGAGMTGLYNPQDFELVTVPSEDTTERESGEPANTEPGTEGDGNTAQTNNALGTTTVSLKKEGERSALPYIPVDTLPGGTDDGTGDLEFRAVAEDDGTIRVAWVSYYQVGSDAVLRETSQNTVIKTADFPAYKIGADAVFYPARVVSGMDGDRPVTGNRVLYPTALDANTTAYVEAVPLTADERTAKSNDYTSALKAAGLDINSSDEATRTIAEQRLGLQRAIWDGSGKQSILCVSVNGELTKLRLPEGQTVDNIEFTRSGDRYYAAYTTQELRFTDAAGNALATAEGAQNVLTIHRLFLSYFTVTGNTVTWANDGKNVLLRTLYDYENNQTLNDGVYTGGAVTAYKEPYFANLQFLNAPLGEALKGDPESFTLMASGTPEDFLLFEMNGATYVIRQGSLESITDSQNGTIIPFFATDENYRGLSEGGSASASGRADVTIGTDGQGGLMAVYVANVPNTTNNGIFMSKYDAATGKWGKGVLLAMNHMSVYEDAIANGWSNEETEKAYLGELDGYDKTKGGMDQFVFTSPSIALGVNDSGNTTLLILTQGNTSYLKHETLGAVQSGDQPIQTVVIDEDNKGTELKPSGTGVYAISYGMGHQTVGKGTLSFASYDFTAGAPLHAVLSFENTGDVSIRGSKDDKQAITVTLNAGGEGIAETFLASWTITENIVPGQKVELEGDFILPVTLPAGADFRIKVAEGDYYQQLGVGIPYTAVLDGLLTVEERPELRFEDITVALAAQKGTTLTLDEKGNAVLNVDFLAGNRGIGYAGNVYVQFSYDTAKTDGDGNAVYAPVDISDNTLSVGEEEKLAALQEAQTGSDFKNGILYLGSMRSGYGRRVTGTVTVSPDQYFVGQGHTLGLRMELFSDADSSVSTDSRGLRSAAHGEYNTRNNVATQTIDAANAFAMSNLLILSKNQLLRLPVQFSASTGSTKPQIVLSELSDKEARDGGKQNMDMLLDRLYYESRSYANGVGTGTVVLRATKVGSGYIRIADANTNSYLDFPFRVIDGAGGMPTYPDNARITFYNKDKSVLNTGAASGQDWAWESMVNGSETSYQVTGKDGASFKFVTEAEYIELYYTGSMRIESTFDSFSALERTNNVSVAQPMQTAGMEPVLIYFGKNQDNTAHTVTITATADNTKFYRIVERYSEPDPDEKDSMPLFFYTTSFPKPGSISRASANSNDPNGQDCVPVRLIIFRRGAPVWGNVFKKLKNHYGYTYNTAVQNMKVVKHGQIPNTWDYSWYEVTFDVYTNCDITLSVSIGGGRHYSQTLHVDWFEDASATLTEAELMDAELLEEEDPQAFDTFEEIEEVEEVEAIEDRWMTATLDESGKTPFFRVKIDDTAPKEYAVIVAGEVEEILELIDSPKYNTATNPEAYLALLEDLYGKNLFAAKRGDELRIPALKNGLNIVYAYCFSEADLTAALSADDDYENYTYYVERADGTVEAYNAMDDLDYNLSVFYVERAGSGGGVIPSGGGSSGSGSSGGGSTPAPTPASETDMLTEAEKDALLGQYGDLEQNAWYRDGVAYVLHKGIMNGMGDGSFGPNIPTSRAMIVTMLYRMEKEPAVSGALTFRDVPGGQWYTDAIRWATAQGIVNGYSDTAFGPNDNVSREQLATILYRYARYKGMDVSAETTLSGFSDAGTVSDWATDALRWTVSNGIINGTGNNNLSPGAEAVRAQVATMLMRYDALAQ